MRSLTCRSLLAEEVVLCDLPLPFARFLPALAAWRRGSADVLRSSRGASGRFGDVEAVIVMAPFAFAKHGLWNLPDGQVREGVRVGAERLATDEQRALVADLFRNRGELLVRQVLRRDVDEVRLRRASLHPVMGFVGLIDEAHELAHGLRELRGS